MPSKQQTLIQKTISDKFRENGVSISRSGIYQVDQYVSGIINNFAKHLSKIQKMKKQKHISIKKGNEIKYGLDATMMSWCGINKNKEVGIQEQAEAENVSEETILANTKERR